MILILEKILLPNYIGYIENKSTENKKYDIIIIENIKKERMKT